MKYQDYIVDATRKAFENAFKVARHVSPEKVAWSPLDEGRSVLSILQELTKCPDWAYDLLGKSAEDFAKAMADPSSQQKTMEDYNKEKEAWTTVEICYQSGKAKLEQYLEFVAKFPDDKLKETKWLPYDGGRDFTAAEQMAYPLWNFQYHEGQINYIETLYGDKSMA